LILLVGAGRFERPTPCAQDGFQRFAKCPYFQMAAFIGDARSLLKAVELYWNRGISQPQFHLQASGVKPSAETNSRSYTRRHELEV
jgi:hypothetical protein